MSLERELERIDQRVEAALRALDIAYATRVPDERKDALFARPEALEDLRAYARWRWSDAVLAESLSAYARRWWHGLTRKVLKIAERFLPELERLESERKRSRPAFWRALCGPSGGVGALGRGVFSGALPANGRPVLPGYMGRRGRG